jgi:hypothetical protein
LPPGAGGKVDFPLLYEKSDPLAAGRSWAPCLRVGTGRPQPERPPARRLERPRRLRARDFGPGASRLVDASPISSSLATLLGSLPDNRRKIERASPGRKIPRTVARKRAPCAEGLGVHRRMPHAARSLSWFASPPASHPGLRTVRHALCCVASHSWTGTMDPS